MLLIETAGKTRGDPLHYSSILGSIGKTLGAEWLPNSQRAILKRYGQSNKSAGDTVALRLLIGAGAAVETMRPSDLQNWIWLIHCMALLSGPNRDPHSTANEASPGAVLQRIGFGDLRLSRLLEARGETFNVLLERATRRIARQGGPINWSRLAPLVLSADPESAWAESARIAISRDFLIAAARSAAEKDAVLAEPLALGRTS